MRKKKGARRRFKTFIRRPGVQNALGGLIAAYIRFVGRTTRWTREPGDLRVLLKDDLPLIMALWHGQHVITPLAWPQEWPGSALVARHADGEVNAIALEKLGFTLVRGSGASRKGGHAVSKRGGVSAVRALLRTLEEGNSVTLTADVPKVAGVAGSGIVLLARLSGRPIYPLAVVTRRHVELDTWDRSRIALPFGRGAVVVGEKIVVPPDASAEELEDARQEVERRLDQVHARAYELIGGKPWRARNG
jgi:lysophospholipid acyltransferase (LPLAT)-like uncharacterized protein